MSLIDDSKGTNEYLASQMFLQRKDLLQVLNSAREAGLKLVAVDDAESINAIFGSSRDKAMAANIANILKFDPESKIVYWVGSMHAEVAADRRDHERACQLIRGQGYKVSSVVPKEKKADFDNNPLFKITGEISKPTLVPMSKAKSFSRLPELKSLYPAVQNFNAWDAVLIYPQEKK